MIDPSIFVTYSTHHIIYIYSLCRLFCRISKMSVKPEKTKTDDYLKQVRELSKNVSISEATAYGSQERPEWPCFSCYTVKSPICPTVPLFPACPVRCCGECCLWYNWFMCACGDPNSNSYSCMDLKGQEHFMFIVDKENGTLAYFNAFDSEHVGCYCTKLF